MICLKGNIIVPDAAIEGYVGIDEGRIINISRDPFPAEQTYNFEHAYIVPGFIDIHMHGAMGHTFNEPTAEAFGTITAETARRGITSLLATTSTAPLPDLIEALNHENPGVRYNVAEALGFIGPSASGALEKLRDIANNDANNDNNNANVQSGYCAGW